ncbi:GNAT family N-acetyltransferase [Massilia agilis]|uniref:GNAT family N-acetyltransferase n=1 Tax=Massilia agilis TaxID=1811226 RepID=A0ABT2DHR6_9BURK|nr:GNAT family N-acetyltransferase [Massilia agilis]MCS0810394.1 GNAT family N-acetyltransferase [Massilia agilis]
MDPYIIRPLEPHDWPAWRDMRLRSLADSPDAFGSTLAEEQPRPADVWAARLAAAAVSGRDRPLVAEVDGAAVGLLWAKVDAADESVVNLFQVWVAPEGRGRGVGASLLREAIHWARSTGAGAVQLGVTQGDTPAQRLYARAGFRPVGAPEPLRPGSPLLSQAMRLALR